MKHSDTLPMIGLLILLSGCATTEHESAAATETAEEPTIIEDTIETTANSGTKPAKCPPGTTEWCVSRIKTEKCNCVQVSRGRDVMERLPNPDWKR